MVPMGWSFSPAMTLLAPAAAQYYAQTRDSADELVAMIGFGYAAPSQMPNEARFEDRTFDGIARMGAKSLWEIDLQLYDPMATAWQPIATRASASGLAGALLGYFVNPLSSVGASFHTGSMPVLVSQSDYADDASAVDGRIQTALMAWKSGGADAVFMSVAVWNTDFASLAAVLAKYTPPSGVTLMTPAQLLGCIH
jgi:hypothetical protein